MSEPLTVAEGATPRLCVIVPCLNERESLPALVATLAPHLEQATNGFWRVLFVDDGSTDGTADLVWDLHKQDPRYAGVRLSRNFGHQAAVATGLKFAEGEFIAVTDCDLQDPVDILLELYQKVSQEDFDVCSGQRGERAEVPFWLRIAYHGFYRLMALMSEHDFTLDSGDFCVFNQKVHHALLGLPERMQVLRGLRSWVGFRQTTIRYHRPPRRHGRSKYNVRRLIQLALSNVVNFSIVPLRLATSLGLAMFCLIVVAMIFFLINRFVPGFAPFGYRISENAGTTTLVMYISLIAAALFVCLGIMGEYIALIVREIKRRPVTLVAEVTAGLRARLSRPAELGPLVIER